MPLVEWERVEALPGGRAVVLLATPGHLRLMLDRHEVTERAAAGIAHLLQQRLDTGALQQRTTPAA
jgi:hypothetical protein